MYNFKNEIYISSLASITPDVYDKKDKLSEWFQGASDNKKPNFEKFNSEFYKELTGKDSFKIGKVDLKKHISMSELNPKQIKYLDRVSKFAVCAAREVLNEFENKFGEIDTTRLSLYGGTNRGEMTSSYKYLNQVYNPKIRVPNPADFPNVARNIFTGYIAIFEKIYGWSSHLSVGELSGLLACIRGCTDIELGRSDYALCGSSEALSRIILDQSVRFFKSDLQSYADDSGTVVPSEGSCFVGFSNKKQGSEAKVISFSQGNLNRNESINDQAEQYSLIVSSLLDSNNLSFNDLTSLSLSPYAKAYQTEKIQNFLVSKLVENKTKIFDVQKYFGYAESVNHLLGLQFILSDFNESDVTDKKYGLLTGLDPVGKYIVVLLENIREE